MKQRQQRELAESVIGKIQKELENPKTLQQILQQSITDVESMYKNIVPTTNALVELVLIRGAGIVSSKPSS